MYFNELFDSPYISAEDDYVIFWRKVTFEALWRPLPTPLDLKFTRPSVQLTLEKMLSAASRGGARLLTRQTGAAVAGAAREFSGSGASSAPIQTVTVVGSGLMGSGIAQVSSFIVWFSSDAPQVVDTCMHMW